jgi:hypothetical protein
MDSQHTQYDRLVAVLEELRARVVRIVEEARTPSVRHAPDRGR